MSSPWYEFLFCKISCKTSEIRNSNNLVVHSNILLCFNLTLNIKKMSYKRAIIFNVQSITQSYCFISH